MAAVYFAMHLAAFLILAAVVHDGQLPVWVLALPAVLVIIALRAAATITPPPYKKIVRGIKMTLMIQPLGCVWLAAWFIFLA
ncbi:MAG: hypothetical protein MAG794_00944 [Gammaproteobacteria bacterium]|nr:hypothetical protein [Gammaproteobacteria bacterium]